MSKKVFDDLLMGFGKLIEIDELSSDQSGYCCLGFDEIIINIEYNKLSDSLFLYSHLGDIPVNNREAVYQTLLEGNYFFRKTSGASLSVDVESNRMVLVYQISLCAIDQFSFEKIIENFVDVTELWKNKIDQLSINISDKNKSGAFIPDFGLIRP